MLASKQFCSGCTACYAICPTSAISMQEDNEGFKYPVIDDSKCVHCGRCDMVCPSLIVKDHAIAQADHQTMSFPPRMPLAVYAAINVDEAIRMQSSSGGMFTLLAQQILAEGGIVYGAGWSPEWQVIHKSAETDHELADLRRSKYVQSDMGDVFTHVKEQLQSGRKVLFSGCPCQVAGLRSYMCQALGNCEKTEILICIDIICHGVPSPKVWKKYLDDLENEYQSKVKEVRFRDKTKEWGQYISIVMENQVRMLKNYKEDSYLYGFLSDLFLRPSCHCCVMRELKSGADITLADYWGVSEKFPHMDDKKGTSLVLASSEKGLELLSRIKMSLKYECSDYADVIRTNHSILGSARPNKNRGRFFELMNTSDVLVNRIISACLRPPWYKRMRYFLGRCYRKVVAS